MKLFDEYSEYRNLKNQAKRLEGKDIKKSAQYHSKAINKSEEIKNHIQSMKTYSIEQTIGRAKKKGLKMLVYWLENEKGNRVN